MCLLFLRETTLFFFYAHTTFCSFSRFHFLTWPCSRLATSGLRAPPPSPAPPIFVWKLVALLCSAPSVPSVQSDAQPHPLISLVSAAVSRSPQIYVLYWHIPYFLPGPFQSTHTFTVKLIFFFRLIFDPKTLIALESTQINRI